MIQLLAETNITLSDGVVSTLIGIIVLNAIGIGIAMTRLYYRVASVENEVTTLKQQFRDTQSDFRELKEELQNHSSRLTLIEHIVTEMRDTLHTLASDVKMILTNQKS